jgi:Flp pilus assembly protein TadD
VSNPDAADGWNNLALVLYENGRFDEAREAASRAVAIGGVRRATYERTLAAIDDALAGLP